MRLLLVLPLLLLSACPPSCGGGPGQAAQVSLGLFQVQADPVAGTLTVSTGGQAVMTVDAALFGFRTAQASFEMEFGMFNIQEQAGDWTGGVTLGHAAPNQEGLVFALQSAGQTVAEGTVTSPEPGHLVLTVTSRDKAHNRARMGLDCADGDHFAGLGAQTHDVDHKGQHVPLWVSEQGIGKTDTDELPNLWQLQGRRHSTHIPMPAVVSSRGIAWLLETHAYSAFDLCRTRKDRVVLEAWEPVIRLHVFAGPTPLEALGRMTRFTGRPPMPAPWAFAPWNDAIFGTQKVREFARFLRDNQVPTSAIWSEDWKGGEWSGEAYRLSEDWTVDDTLYPDFEGLCRDLRGMGMTMQMYFNTFIYQDADIYAEAERDGHLIKDVSGAPYLFTGAKFTESGLADLTRKETRTWVKSFLKKGIELGSLGWMADFAEWMPVQGARLGSGEDPALVHNQYPRLWQEVNEEAMVESGKRADMVVFYRSGHLFSQKWAGVVWAGDQRTSFEPDDGLPSVIPMGLGLAATGFPFFAHDIAGYQSATNPPSTKELFFRWTQLGAFTPVMRTHHGTHPRQNWHLAKDDDTLAHYKRYASLHMRLYPYLRGLSKLAVEQGQPLWIPLGLVHPDDANAWPIKDQFLLGPGLLVAPVVVDGARSREVYFPHGRHVPLLAGGEAVVGPVRKMVDAPISEIPVFITSGGLVPLTENTAQTLFPGTASLPGLESTTGNRVLYVGLGRDGVFVEEDGARYTLTGTGTDASTLNREADGSVLVDGNGTVQGKDFKLVLAGHPAPRKTRVFFR